MSIPTAPAALKIHALYGRRATTHWSPVEVKEYKARVKEGCFDNMEDLDLAIRYTQFEMKKGSEGFHRRDILRFLRHYPGVLDRAREWARERSARVNRFCGFKKSKEEGKRVSDEEFKRIGALAKQQLEEFKKQNGVISTPRLQENPNPWGA